MLKRKQLEDASKCFSCDECLIYENKNHDCRYRPNCEIRLAQTALTLLDMLKSLEWIKTREGSDYIPALFHCPCCENEQGEGHAEDCELGNLLREVEG